MCGNMVKSNVDVTVLRGGEPREPLVVKVDPKRVVRRDRDVEPDVELVAVDEQRVGHIPAHHRLLVQPDDVHWSRQDDKHRLASNQQSK